MIPMNEIPVVELFDIQSLNNVALVTIPAIEETFLAFSKESEAKQIQLSVMDEEKRIVCGPALIPDKKILRVDESGEPFYAFFSEDTVRHISEEFLKDGKTHSFNLQHEEDVDDLYITESWIIENPELDKSHALGMNLPKGTWMLAAKIPNDYIWARVKSGELRGFSIDGLFSMVMTEEEQTLSKIIDILKEVE